MRTWLLTPDARDFVERAYERGVGEATAEQRSAFAAEAAEVSARGDEGPRNLKIAGNTAEIRVEGALTRKFDLFLWWFGMEQTTYDSITAALAIAEANPDVSDIVLFIDSPGGEVAGMFETMEAIEAAQKPVTVRASLAASAAYGLASMADSIVATGPSATFGSVGVVASYLLQDDVVDITSTEAPDKRPDLSTKEGQAVVRKHLDDIHALFAQNIARGRGTTEAKVNKNFGRGAVMLADEALKRGLIDSLPQTQAAATTTRAGAQQPKETRMTLDELRAQHPTLVAEVEAAERRRCLDHLQLGEAAGIPDKALEAIKSGETVASMQATYLAANMNKRDIADAQADAKVTEDAAGEATPTDDTDRSEAVHDEVAAVLKGGTHV